MFRRLVQRFNAAVSTPNLAVACCTIVMFAYTLPEYVDDWVDRYMERQEQKQKALKDTSGRRDGH